jgi:zinc protease
MRSRLMQYRSGPLMQNHSGVDNLPAAEFKKRYLALGARLSAASGRTVIFGALESLASRFDDGVDLLRLMVTAPRFDGEAVEQVRSRHLSELQQAASAPEKVALQRWYAEAFADYPYGRPPNGTPDSVASITGDDLKEQHRRLFGRDVLRVVLVGDLDRSRAVKALDDVFGSLPEKAETDKTDKIEPRKVDAPIVAEMDRDLSAAVFGLPAIDPEDPDFPALQLLMHMIGSGDFDSRLMQEVRVKKGLAYAIRMNVVADNLASVMVGDVATKNENMGKALAGIREVLASAARDGFDARRVEDAKSYLTKSFLLDFDSNAKMASSLLTLWLLGKSPEYLQTRNKALVAVGPQDVKRVAERLLSPDRMVVTIAGRPNLQE